MSAELRFLAFAVVCIAAVPAVVFGNAAPLLLALGAAAIAIAALGLIPPMPPMVNGVAAVLAGATLSAVAVASGGVGVLALAFGPAAVASLRIGWRPAAWAGALGLLAAALLVPGLFGPPLLLWGPGAWLAAASLSAWGLLHARLGRQAASTGAHVARWSAAGH